ncbi:hypothetical protein U27_03009 [Candidatus Vecturithrix granuli]|uniref:Uncharacterized protein n=1 Tax=Vecturithrix granuli TaxID=1499967 RepID=A0A081BUP2_VECG1|nr:hypothetical protein U27_03009 [Candidatus Vecturithrix granuli]
MIKGQSLISWFLLIVWIVLLPLRVAGQSQNREFASAGPATIEVSGYEENLQQRDAEQLRWMGMILLGILGLLGLQMYKRFVKSGQFSQEDVAIFREQRQLMLKELACLDQQYALGKMSENLYLAERRQRKQQLIELTILCQIL